MQYRSFSNIQPLFKCHPFITNFFLFQEPGQDPPLHLDVVSQSPLVELNFSVLFFLAHDTGNEFCPGYFVEGPRFGVCLMIPPD